MGLDAHDGLEPLRTMRRVDPRASTMDTGLRLAVDDPREDLGHTLPRLDTKRNRVRLG
jgi:hypothetical protein